MLRRLLPAVAVATVLASSATPARAQEDPREQSRAAFRRGVAQAEAGDYTAARDSFLEAYRLFAHPSILLNLGIARGHTGEWLEAEADLVHFLADDGGARPDELASARVELAQARRHLGTFRLRVAPAGATATLDARPVALIQGSFVDVRATRGAHALYVEAQGYPPLARSIDLATERGPDVDIVLSARGESHPAPDGSRRIAGWYFVGAGVVAAGVGTFAGLRAQSLASDYNTPGSGHFQDASTKASGIVFRTSADVAWLGALALGGVGAYLLLTPSAGSGAQARVVVGPWTGLAGVF